MKSYLIIPIVLFTCIGCVFGQTNYRSSIKEHKVKNGVILSIQYWTLSDSNNVYIGLTSSNVDICYAGYNSQDTFPHKKEFDVSIKLKDCRRMEEAALFKEVKLVYDGKNSLLNHAGISYDVDKMAIHNITLLNDFSTKVYKIKTVQDIDSLSSDLQKGFESFLLKITSSN